MRQATIQDFKKLTMQFTPKYCESCGAKYIDEDLNILNKFDDSLLAHLKCHSCGLTFILNVLLNKNNSISGTSRMPFNTDLGFEELSEIYRNKKTIEADDILEVYNYLYSPEFIKDINSKSSKSKQKKGKKA